MSDRKDKFAVLSYFQKRYKDTLNGQNLVINKYTAQWDADALIDSYGIQMTKQLIDRYFSLSEHPSWKGFARDAQKIYNAMVVEWEDEQSRKLMRQKVRTWMND